MKKVLLFLLCALVSIGTRAGSSVGTWKDYSYLLIEINDDPGLDAYTGDPINYVNWNSKIVIKGTFINQIGITNIGKELADKGGITLDLTGSTTNSKNCNWKSIPLIFSYLFFAPGTTLPSPDVLATGTNLKYAYSASKDGGPINLYVGAAAAASDIESLLTGVSLDENSIVFLSGDVSGVAKTYLAGKNIPLENIIDKSKIETTASNLETAIASYKAKVGDLADLQKLIITEGEVTSAVFSTIAGELKDVKTVDFSKATISAGAFLESGAGLKWETILLPAGTTLPKEKVLETYTGLKYVYSAGGNGEPVNLYIGTATSLDDMPELKALLDATGDKSGIVINISGDTSSSYQNIKDAIKAKGVKEENIIETASILETSASDLKTNIAQYKDDYNNSLDRLLKLVVTGGNVDTDLFSYLATELKSVKTIDLSKATLPDGAAFPADGSGVSWENVLLPAGTTLPKEKVLETYTGLKYVYSAGSNGGPVNLYAGTAASLDDIPELKALLDATGDKSKFVVNLFGDKDGKIKTALLAAGVEEANIIYASNILQTTVEELTNSLAAYKNEYGDTKNLKKLIVTGGTFDETSYNLLACEDLKNVNTVDLTDAELPDDVRFKDGTEVDWEILILPKGTKIAPNFPCYPNLKFAMGGGFNKIWLISRYDPTVSGSQKLRESGIEKLFPEGITSQPDTERIGVAFVGHVEPEDVVYFVGSGNAPLKNARIWHLRDAKKADGTTDCLTMEDIKGLVPKAQGNNDSPTGLVLPLGMDVDDVKGLIDGVNDSYKIGNIYSLSSDQVTLTASIKKTETFDIARFSTTKTRKVRLVSGSLQKNGSRNNMVRLDTCIINALKGTKRAKSVDISALDAPLDTLDKTTPKAFGYLLNKVKTGTVEYIRIPSTDKFDIRYYEGTTFGAIARMKNEAVTTGHGEGSTADIAVVYQRVPNTLYRNMEYRSDDIIENKRIRYRGMMNMNDIRNILQDNTNEYYDLSDVKMVMYKNTDNWNISPKDFKDEMVYEIEDPDMSEIKNDKVKYIALPAGTSLYDKPAKEGEEVDKKARIGRLVANCPNLLAVGVINSERGTTEDSDQKKNTIFIHSWQENSTAPVVMMLADKTDFESAYPTSNNANGSPAQDAATANAVNADLSAKALEDNPVVHIVMSGKLSFCDIANSSNMDADGHYKKTTNAAEESGSASLLAAFNGGYAPYSLIFGGFKTADFTDAVFPHAADMTFSAAGRFSGVTDIKLPTSPEMTEIPDECLLRFKAVTDLCIPCNYEIIGTAAFKEMTGLKRIITTPSGKEGQDGNITDRGDSTIVLSYNLKQIKTEAFWGIEKMNDVYVLAEIAPKCAAGAFDQSMCYGDNGFHNVHPVQRINYKNGDTTIGMLHFPRVCRENGENVNYTDVTRKYTLFDETGRTNGYGEPLTWPRHEEFGKAWNQAQDGVLWDGVTTYDTDYQGWHEFVLAANYYRKRESDDVSVRNYSRFKENDWYTICVPYNITRSTLKKLLGADAGETVDLKSGETITAGEDGLGPDVRTLVKVKRSNKNSLVTFVFSENLMDKEINGRKGADIKLSNNGKTYEYVAPEVWNGNDGTEEDDPIIIKGGYPYIIKPYLSAEKRQKFETEEFLLELPNNVATKNLPSVGYTYENQIERSFTAAPCPVHKVHAIDEDKTTDSETVYVYEGGDETKPYFYHFAGTYSYSGQSMPKYCFFLATKKNSTAPAMFYRATSENFSWTRCTAIMAGRSEAEITGGKYETGNDGVQSITNIYIDFMCNDDSFNADFSTGNVTGAKFAMAFGDEGGSTTGITETDCNKGVTGNGGGYVYSISGKRMGTSLDGLPKGIYIKDGKKYVVNK